jgi:hypothetical protein
MPRSAASDRRARRLQDTELQHRREIIASCPMLDEFAVFNSIPVTLMRRELPPGRWHHSVELSEIRPFREDERSDSIAVGDQ